MKLPPKITAGLALTVAAWLAGCAHNPAPVDADGPTLPAGWRAASVASTASSDDVSREWWLGFGSPELHRLITQAHARSHDVAGAIARVRQAEASVRITGASLLPGLTANLSAGRERRLGGEASVDARGYTAGLAASYEIDFWGLNRTARDAAAAALRATAFDRDTVQLTVSASVALAWLQGVALRDRLAIAGGNLANAERLLAVARSRVRAGAATALELAQQRGVVAAQRRTIAALRQQAEDSRTALALLLGQAMPPEAGIADAVDATHAADSVGGLSRLRAPAIAVGVPSDLLARRPDVARAEAHLAAAQAQVAVARAAMLPRFTLAASLGSGGERWRSVFDNPFYNLAAGLAGPVFDGGRLAASRDLAQARRDELLAGYHAAIVAAAADVETALNAVAGSEAQQAAHAEALQQAQRAFALAESRYRAGAETLLTLLDTQRTLYAAQDTAAQLRFARLAASVALYRALGGGWRIADNQAAAAAAATTGSAN